MSHSTYALADAYFQPRRARWLPSHLVALSRACTEAIFCWDRQLPTSTQATLPRWAQKRRCCSWLQPLRLNGEGTILHTHHPPAPYRTHSRADQVFRACTRRADSPVSACAAPYGAPWQGRQAAGVSPATTGCLPPSAPVAEGGTLLRGAAPPRLADNSLRSRPCGADCSDCCLLVVDEHACHARHPALRRHIRRLWSDGSRLTACHAHGRLSLEDATPC